MRAAIGGGDDVARFFRDVLAAANVPAASRRDGRIDVRISPETPRALRQAIGRDEPFSGRFDLPLAEGEVHLGRTSPVVEGLASWVLDQALDPEAGDGAAPVAARCGALMTEAVSERTTLLVARFRYHLSAARSRHPAGPTTLLCEEIVPLAAVGPASAPRWCPPEAGEALLAATPARNLLPTAIAQQLDLLLPTLPDWQAALAAVARERANDQLAAHDRVRVASGARGVRARSRTTTVEPVLPVDLLGAWVLLPKLG